MPSWKIALLSVFALLAFAANSVLCRLALADGLMDAASFTIIRLFSGAMALLVLMLYRHRSKQRHSKGSWLGAMFLFVYAIAFSFAYISLNTGTGALILFTVVQLSMISYGLATGNKPRPIEWLGISTAFAGFVIFVWPSLSTPSAFGLILMAIAGIAWAAYTLNGRGSADPIGDTAYNFLKTLPLLAIALLLSLPTTQISSSGVVLAILSGVVASGLGYTLWYQALKGLSISQAAVIQLLVPIIAALGGIVFASETISLNFIVASVLILGGILMLVLKKQLPTT